MELLDFSARICLIFDLITTWLTMIFLTSSNSVGLHVSLGWFQPSLSAPRR